MAEELLDAVGLVCRDRLVAAVGVEPGRMPESARSALTSLAQFGPGMCDRLVELIELARQAAEDEADALCDYPLFRADESVTVTVTVGELVELGLVPDATGVGWADRDECRSHVMAGAAGRPVADRNVRGIVLFEGMGLDCIECRREVPPIRSGASVGSEPATGVVPAVESSERPATAGELCTCGRPATIVSLISLGAEVDRIWPEAGGTVVCFGAGGSARALCLHLLRRDRRPQGVVVCESDERRALQLRELLAPEAARSTVGLEVLGGRSLWDDVLSDLGPASLVVNATGLGKVDRQCPLSGRACFPESATVWDLNYRGPLPYLWLARHQPDSGLDVVDGLSLFARGWLAALDALFGIGCPERFTRPFWKIAKGLNVP